MRAATVAREAGATVKTYLLIKRPFLTEREAIEDAVRPGHDADPHSDTVSFNRVNDQSRTIVDRLVRRGEYRPPWLWSVVEVLERTRDLKAHVKSHPTAGGLVRGAHNCGTCDRRVVNAIEEFSLGLRADFGDLSCACQDVWRAYGKTQPFMMTSADPLAVLLAENSSPVPETGIADRMRRNEVERGTGEKPQGDDPRENGAEGVRGRRNG